MTAARLVRAVLTGLLGTLTGLAFGPVFDGLPGPFVVAVAATTGAATLVVLVAVLFPRLSPTLIALAGAAVVAVTAAAVTGSGVALVDGPRRLLTGALPYDASGPPLGGVALAAGLSTLLAGLLAAYAETVLAPVIPPLVCLLAALGLGASGPPIPSWYGPVTVALVLALLLTGRSASARPGVIVAAVLGCAVAVAVAAFLGPSAPGAQAREPADARALVAPPVLPRSGVSPLQQYLALRDESLPVRITGTSSRPHGPLRMATLTRFDGTYWTVAGDFRLAGERLPRPPSVGRLVSVTSRIRVSSGDPDWVLSPGRATRISVGGLGVDESTGDVAVPAGKASPAAYDTTSLVNDVGVDALSSATPVRAPEPLSPPLPAALQSFVDRSVAGRTSTGSRLAALYQTFRDDGGFLYDQAKDVAGGHGYYQIQQLLRTKRGTSEQYASAFAMMARGLGVDARVVMGFQPEYRGSVFTVTGRDVDAWAEVRLTGLGWVTVDPSPREHPIGTRPDQPRQASAARQVPNPQKNLPRKEKDTHSAPTGHGPPQDVPEPAGHRLEIALLAVALLVALVLSVPGAKTVRRARRRRDRSPRRAVLGAWWETVDRLREAGVPAGPSLTTGQVAALTDLPEVSRLATIVDHAAYAPDGASPDLPEQAWAAATRIRRGLHTRMGLRRRVGALLDPRTLLRRRA